MRTGLLIVILLLVVVVGCKDRYYMDGARCRDTQTGQYVATELCK